MRPEVARGWQRGVPAARSGCGPSLPERRAGEHAGVEEDPSGSPASGLFYLPSDSREVV